MAAKPKVTFRIDPELLKKIDHLIELRLFTDRSQFLVFAAEQQILHYEEFEKTWKEGTYQ